jgi:hypothetical protein
MATSNQQLLTLFLNQQLRFLIRDLSRINRLEKKIIL